MAGFVQSGREIERGALDSLKPYSQADQIQKSSLEAANKEDAAAQKSQNMSLGAAAGGAVGGMAAGAAYGSSAGPYGFVIGAVVGGIAGSLF